ncbi:response regulator transcription factor [Isoptericola sp. NEAU-Y5]|uniref:Response regulator transcription factor n=1 Tax=Isoptericola luteus TaxID=2879484 RepID=A0ABS7ZLL7_9MICO|nr:response regulator transcription factor [Isoptericola sp. NEAU-Y5]MCA5894549.1 response regulator transcription factor [Isoptericola sp. NEAU-Y5]
MTLPSSSDRAPTRIALVDDEPLVRAGLRVILDAEPDLVVVAEADDGTGVPALVAESRPDVVLMDVRMPRVDGIAATRAVVAGDRPGAPAPRVLVLTTFENDDHVLDALHAGAQGFLLKRARPEEVAQAVRVVARGDSLLFPDAVRRLVASAGATDGGDGLRGARLTEREGEVLRLVAAGLSNAEIAARLYLGVETVRTHVGNVLAKLGVRDRTQAVVRAYESGFVPVRGGTASPR